MNYYPVFLDLHGRSCLVIGSGRLADEKSAGLERAGAVVVRKPAFDEKEAIDAWLIVAVTDDSDEADQLREFADKNGILLNVVDQTEYCNFIAPAILEREDLLIAVSTSGKCPALASRIRQELEAQYGPEYGQLVRALGDIRPEVKKKFGSYDERKAFYHRVLNMDLAQIAKERGSAGLGEALRDALGD